MVKNIFVFTDNIRTYLEFKKILDTKEIGSFYFCSPKSTYLFKSFIDKGEVTPVTLRDCFEKFIESYDLGISCHSKQIFPEKLVNSLLCVNLHPGYNPYNRGWCPQVFSIINHLPAGATLHVMDEKIDHGDIIAQEKVDILAHDSSLTSYDKIQKKEIDLLKDNIDSLLSGEFTSRRPFSEGNYNTIKDYKDLYKIDLEKEVTMLEAIDYLRALSHPPYKNAYFIDDQGNKIYVSLNLEMQKI